MSNKPQKSPKFHLFLYLTCQNSSVSGDLSLSMTTQKRQKLESETEKESSEKASSFFFISNIEPPVLWPQGFPHHVLPGWHRRILFPAKPWVIASFFMDKRRAGAACSEIFGECWSTAGNAAGKNFHTTFSGLCPCSLWRSWLCLSPELALGSTGTFLGSQTGSSCLRPEFYSAD